MKTGLRFGVTFAYVCPPFVSSLVIALSLALSPFFFSLPGISHLFIVLRYIVRGLSLSDADEPPPRAVDAGAGDEEIRGPPDVQRENGRGKLGRDERVRGRRHQTRFMSAAERGGRGLAPPSF